MAKNLFNLSKEKIYLYLFIALILILFLLPLFLYAFTGFEKKITIKEKYIRYRKGSNYNIVSTDNEIYQINNLWFKGDFNRAEDYAKIEVGKTYNVKGYGIRVGFLNMYKTIYEIN